MVFKETGIKGAYVIDLDRKEDSRGYFARSYCAKEFAAHNLSFDMAQSNISYNAKRGTLRGMHFQKEPYAEDKIVSCVNGAVYDVIIDLRKDSSSYGQWFGTELSRKNRSMVYVPKGLAHGFLTLMDDTDVLYYMSASYQSESAAGVRWDDAVFGIVWPDMDHLIISEKDQSYADFVKE